MHGGPNICGTCEGVAHSRVGVWYHPA